MREDVKVDSILVVEHGRLPIDEAVEGYHADHCCRCYERAAAIHLWRREPGGNPILVASIDQFHAAASSPASRPRVVLVPKNIGISRY